ncbi:MAG: ABC transporter permease [Terracidiphilus sp.]
MYESVRAGRARTGIRIPYDYARHLQDGSTATGLVLAISTKARTQAEALQLTMGTILPSVFLSGHIFLIENMPPIFQVISRIIPATYYIRILHGIIFRRAGGGDLWLQAAVLTAIGCAAILLAASQFVRHKIIQRDWRLFVTSCRSGMRRASILKPFVCAESEGVWIHVDINLLEARGFESRGESCGIDGNERVVKVKKPKEPAVEAIGSCEDPTRAQGARHLRKKLILQLRRSHMMEHRKGDSSVEARIGERHLRRVLAHDYHVFAGFAPAKILGEFPVDFHACELRGAA